eukprot:1947395-Prymnesium_polylepis.1
MRSAVTAVPIAPPDLPSPCATHTLVACAFASCPPVDLHSHCGRVPSLRTCSFTAALRPALRACALWACALTAALRPALRWCALTAALHLRWAFRWTHSSRRRSTSAATTTTRRPAARPSRATPTSSSSASPSVRSP